MQINRRNFLKIAGITTVSAMMPVKGLSGGIQAENQRPDKSLKKIYLEAYKKHPQKFNMCGYAAPKLGTVRVGFIGVGSRGSAAVERMSRIDGVKIVAICDELPESAEKAKARIQTPGHPAILYSGKEDVWKEICEREDIDLIYVATPLGVACTYRDLFHEAWQACRTGNSCSHHSRGLLATGGNLRTDQKTLCDTGELLL